MHISVNYKRSLRTFHILASTPELTTSRPVHNTSSAYQYCIYPLNRQPKEMIRLDLLRPQILSLHLLKSVFFHIATSHCNNAHSELFRVQYSSTQRSEKGRRQVYFKTS